MDLDKILDSIEVDTGLSQVDIKSHKITTSTGLLTLDLMLSGGMVTGGWYTMFGGEQSSKSTLVMTQMARAVNTPIPYICYFDYEGSFDSNYMLSIARHVGVISNNMPEDLALQKLFGLKDDKDNWVIKPRIRYYPMSIGEKFFDYLAKLQRALPDKLYKNGEWWLVYDDSKENKKLVKSGKLDYDKKLYKNTGKYWVKTTDGYPQALIAVDSYPAMTPGKMDVDDPSIGLGAQARMFSEHIKRVKGKMSSKRITVMGVNQLRLKPMVAYGNPEYEPGGEALKFYCFSEDTMLTTNKGLLYADEVEKLQLLGNIPNIQGIGSLENPSAYSFMGESEIIKLNLDKGFTIKGKPGHKVLALNTKVNIVDWKSLEELEKDNSYKVPIKVGSYVFNEEKISIDYNVSIDNLVVPSESSEKLAEFLGFILLLGFPYENRVLIAHNSRKVIEKVCKTYSEVFKTPEEHPVKYDNFYEFYSNEGVIEFLESIGLTFDYEKSAINRIPWIIRTGTENDQRIFLETIFKYADDPESDLAVFSGNYKVCFEVQQMLLNFGIVSELYYNEDYDIYIIDANLSINDLINRLYNKSEYISSILSDFIQYKSLEWLDIKSIERNEKQATFDANMPITSTILTNGAVSHNSDVRIRMASRSVQGGSGQFEEEEGIYGGTDQYRYIHMRAHKNKLSVPNLEGWARIWVRDAEGVAHGYDPVYDCFTFMKEIGILTGSKNRLKIDLPKMKGHKSLSWLNFKKIILGDKKLIKNVLNEHGIEKPFYLRDELFKLIESGKASEMFFSKKKGETDSEEDDEED